MSAAYALSRHDLDCACVEPLPERTVLSLLPGLPPTLDTSNLATLVGHVGATSGNAEQTAPIVQGLTTRPALPAV
jgi:hypothetical protein